MRALVGGALAVASFPVALHLAATVPPLVAVIVAACVFYTGGRIAAPSAR